MSESRRVDINRVRSRVNPIPLVGRGEMSRMEEATDWGKGGDWQTREVIRATLNPWVLLRTAKKKQRCSSLCLASGQNNWGKIKFRGESEPKLDMRAP